MNSHLLYVVFFNQFSVLKDEKTQGGSLNPEGKEQTNGK